MRKSSPNRAFDHTKMPIVVEGARSAFAKPFTSFADSDALELTCRTVDALLERVDIEASLISELIVGTALASEQYHNLARDAIINLKLPTQIQGHTLSKSCISSLQALADASLRIGIGDASAILCGGVECLSARSLFFSTEARKFLLKLAKPSPSATKLKLLKQLSQKAWQGQVPTFTDPLTGITLLDKAREMAQCHKISQKDQEEYALLSHSRARLARSSGVYDREIAAIWTAPYYLSYVDFDNSIQQEWQSPLKDQDCAVLCDGASFLLLCNKELTLDMNLSDTCYIRDIFKVAGNPSDRNFLASAVAIAKILDRNDLCLSDIDVFEIHEPFAASVLACQRALNSRKFCDQYLGKSKPLGEISLAQINTRSGAIALGHPIAATGSRMIMSAKDRLITENTQLALICAQTQAAQAICVLLEHA